MSVNYKYPNAIASVWHYRYDQNKKKFVTIKNDTYSYVEREMLIPHYEAKEGDFLEYGTNSGGGNIVQVRNGQFYAPKGAWSNNRAFNAAWGTVYAVPVTAEEMAELVYPYTIGL